MELINAYPSNIIKEEKFRLNFFNIGFILFIILSQINVSKWGASISYIAIPAFLLVIGAFFTRFRFNKDSFLIFLLFGVYVVSTVFSEYVPFGREMFSFLVFCVFFIFATSHEYTVKEIRVFFIVYIIVSMLVCLNISYQWLTKNYLHDWSTRSTFIFMGVEKDPNYVFSYICLSFVISFLIFFFTKRKKLKVFCFANFLITFFALMCASSRAAMLTVAVCMALTPFFCTQLQKKQRIFIFFVLIATIALGYLFMVNFYSEYGLKRIFEDKDGAGRTEIWGTALTVFKKHPIIGGGFNAGSSVSLIYRNHNTHSVFIDILCDSGIVGMICFLIFYFKNCFWPNWNNFEVQAVLGASALIPLLFINGFNTTIFYFPLIFLSIINTCLKHYDYSVLFSFDDSYLDTNSRQII